MYSGSVQTQTITGDTKDNTATFTSGDATSPTAWTDVATIASGEKHSSLFNKLSTMIKNVRYLYKMLGTTDISKIGNGTCTGAISTINSNLIWTEEILIDGVILRYCEAIKTVKIEYNFSPDYVNDHNIYATLDDKYIPRNPNGAYSLGNALSNTNTIVPIMSHVYNKQFRIYINTTENELTRFRGCLEYIVN